MPFHLTKGSWAVPFDTETTGLVKSRLIKLDKQPEVIEFYGCLVNLDNGKIDRELDLLIRPTVEFPMTPFTIKETKTKLSNAMLEPAPQFSEVKEIIKDLLERAPLVIAHNLSFDKEMIEIELERLGEKIEWPPGLCTVEQTAHLKGVRLNLTKLHQFLFDGATFEDAHRARYDVMAMTRCAVELQKRGLL